MSTIKIQADMNMQTFQSTPAWIVADQLSQLFDVQDIEVSALEIPEAVDLLVMVHPHGLSEDTEYAIDQFVMRGGRILAFIDPQAEQSRQAANPMMGPAPVVPSSLGRLLKAWGAEMDAGKVLGDAQIALSVGGANGQPVRHLALVGAGPENFNAEDITVSALENINFATAGILRAVEGATTAFTPLIESTEYAAPIDTMRLQFLSDPSELQA